MVDSHALEHARSVFSELLRDRDLPGGLHENAEKIHYNIEENICDFATRPKYYLQWREFGNLEEL